MCYLMYYYCPTCKQYELTDQDATWCKYGDYLHGLKGVETCGRLQNLIVKLYHKLCYLRAGGTEARFNRVNDQLKYEVNEWLYTDDDSYPERNGGTKIFENFCNADAYRPGGTKYAPRNYKTLRRKEAQWYDQDVETAMKQLRDFRE
jgi:hypothetical protein